MAKTVFTEDEMDELFDQILKGTYQGRDKMDPEPWRGGTKIDLDLSEIERDEDEIFGGEGPITVAFTGYEETTSTYAFRCDLVDDEGRHLVGAGWHSLPDHSDDESDAYLNMTLYVCADEDVEAARLETDAIWARHILASINENLNSIVELLPKAGDGLSKALAENDNIRRIMRAMAAGI